MSLQAFSRYFALFAGACALFPFISGIIRFRQRTLYLKLLCIVAGVSLLCDFLSDRYHTRNLIVNVSALFEFVAFLLLFFLIFEKKDGRFLTLIGIGGAVFGVTNFTFIQQDHFNTYTVILTAIIIIPLSIIFFYRTMRDSPEQKIHQIPAFWIVSGALLYYSGLLFLLSIYDFLTADAEPPYIKLLIYWDFHALVSIAAQMLFGISFWQKDSFIHHASIDVDFHRSQVL